MNDILNTIPKDWMLIQPVVIFLSPIIVTVIKVLFNISANNTPRIAVLVAFIMTFAIAIMNGLTMDSKGIISGIIVGFLAGAGAIGVNVLANTTVGGNTIKITKT